MLPVNMFARSPIYDSKNRPFTIGMVPKNLFYPTSSTNKPVQIRKDIESFPERSLWFSFNQRSEGSEQTEVGMSPDSLLFDKSITLSSSRSCQFEGISPERLLCDKSIEDKFFISLMEGGMLPFRRFLERSRRFNIDILLPMSEGIGPVSKLFLNERFVTFDQSENEPSKRLYPKLIHGLRPTCIDLGSTPLNWLFERSNHQISDNNLQNQSGIVSEIASFLSVRSERRT